MVNREVLNRAEEKLTFAEYLVRQRFTDESHNISAVRHAIEAGRLAVEALIDVRTSETPQAMQLALMKFDEDEPKKFARNFIKNWQATGDDSSPGRASANAMINDVRNFINWMKKTHPLY